MTASTPRRLRLGLLSIALLLLVPIFSVAHAQDIDIPTVTTTYALEDVEVVQAPGETMESATVVVRDGVIEDVGPNVDIPYDARRLEGDTLVVYAGFIDGLSHAGVDTPDDESDDFDDPGDPPRDLAGIQPERSAQDMLHLEDSDLESLRQLGFTAAHVVPEGRMLPGKGAHVLYGGASDDDMLLESDPTLFAQIQGSGNFVYPATDMAVIAQMRQLFREADRRQMLEESYAEDPTGQSRPPRDPAHSALFPVLDGDLPLAFYADDALSIHRALALQEELNFPLILSGLGEAHYAVDQLAEADVPSFLTLDLPDEPPTMVEEDTTIADTTANPEEYYDPDFRTTSHDDVQDEAENLQLRHAMERQEYLETAATLHDADIPFGFMSRDASAGDIRDNLRTMVDHGLPEEAALAALTTYPASALGLDNRLGTVEAGKMANLVVTDGSYFDEDSEVEYVLVNGHLYDFTGEVDEGEVTGDVSDVLGTWQYTLETPQGDVEGELVIEGDETGLEGTFVVQGEEESVDGLSYDGETLSFSVSSPQGTLSFRVTVEDETFDGTVTGDPFGSLPVSGERVSGPDQ